MAKQPLIGLQASTYEHNFDKTALKTVKSIPLLPEMTKKLLTWTIVKQDIISMCGSNFHVTQSACSELSSLTSEVFRTLDLDHRPEVYVEQNYYINAYTTGHQEEAFIVLSSGAVDKLSDNELQFVVGHEAGHILSGHVLYHLMCAYLGQLLSLIPGAKMATMGPLLYWNRMSEFTADRAGLLACQNLDSALSAIMKMSGLPEKYYETASVEGFKQQAREFQDKYASTSDKLFKMIEIVTADHPWTVVRAAELIKWHESGEYAKIVENTDRKQCPVCKSWMLNHELECPSCGHIFKD